MSNLERANKCTIQANEDGYVARFVRTHKDVKTISSKDTTWVPNPKLNATANRELFRLWVCENSQEYGINYDSEDRRSADNQYPSRYDSQELLMSTAAKLISADVQEWVAKLGEGVTMSSLVGETVKPITTYKGKTVEPQYKSGTWAWAQVSVVATVVKDEVESYVTMVVSLVSGQLKKPASIGDSGYTATGFRAEVAKDIPSLAPVAKTAE